MNKSEIIKYAVKELFVQGNLDVVDEIFTLNYTAHAEKKQHNGLDFIKRFNKTLRTSIPDISVLNIEFFIEENDKISWQRTLQGTHQKNMMGIPASKKMIQWNEMIVSRFTGNKIEEEWIVSELKGELLLKLK